MNPALLGQLLPYLAYAPDAIEVTLKVIARVKEMLAAGPVTDEMLQALAVELCEGHEDLPKPRV